MPTERQTAWKIISKTVRGPTHDRLELPNQDHIKIAQSDLVIVAVSDGHGSAKCFRSDVGSRIAAQAAIDVVERFFKGDWTGSSFADKKSEVEFGIPKGIAREWRERVSVDVEQSPFNDKERERLVAQEGDETFARIVANPHLAYGATILTVAISEDLLVYLQLGDGDILAVFNSGEVARPLPSDDRLFANETTSLSSGTAWQDFRTGIQLASRGLPSLILLATDGYSNSFKDDASFLKAGSDFLDLIRSEGGIDEVEKHLGEWLSESAQMSGDDVTLGLLYRHSSEPEESSEAVATAQSLLSSSSTTLCEIEAMPSSTTPSGGEGPSPSKEAHDESTRSSAAVTASHDLSQTENLAVPSKLQKLPT